MNDRFSHPQLLPVFMIKIGILGAGPNGSGNAKRLAEHTDRCRIAAVADPNEEAARKLADQHSGAVVHANLEPMLETVDAVVVSSPNWLHPEHTLTCAAAGKHVWIEKPMALTVADAQRMAEAVKAAGVASMIGFSVRFDGKSQWIKQQASEGAFGEIFSACSRRNVMFPPEVFAGWRGDFARSGGVMSELIIHEVDWVVDLLGFPRSIYCQKRAESRGGEPHPRANDHVWLTLGYGNGRTATIEGSQCAPIAEFYKSVIGTEASAHTRRWGQELYLAKKGGKDKQIEFGTGFDKHGHWLDVIEGKCASVADVDYGARITRLIDTALDSAVRGEVLPFEA